ncbi:MAG: hypothetical protein RLZZ241_97 [Bacteroidota bacterium]
MKLFLGLLLIIPMSHYGQYQLEVHVEGVENSIGIIQVALFNSESGFLKSDHAYKLSSVPANAGTTRVQINNLPKGTYALAIFHDLNANRQLDTNWIGIPKEPMGFSNAHVKAFGPPGFEECRLELQRDMVISVQLE